ncbi:RNA polymerase sigma factor [Pedobacter faecalis]|uniref:RNA polymerase sigma factor n=1 Tax=Pedobacter faecalis TaxID=3041495 RepID=UPI0025506EE3|nr:sigma factor [Pedobacter sp. ELA7]
MITTKTGQEDYWIERLKDGDNTALAHFFELHSRPLTYFAGRLLGDGAEAEDVVSKCFLKVWEKRGSFKTPQNIKRSCTSVAGAPAWTTWTV